MKSLFTLILVFVMSGQAFAQRYGIIDCNVNGNVVPVTGTHPYSVFLACADAYNKCVFDHGGIPQSGCMIPTVFPPLGCCPPVTHGCPAAPVCRCSIAPAHCPCHDVPCRENNYKASCKKDGNPIADGCGETCALARQDCINRGGTPSGLCSTFEGPCPERWTPASYTCRPCNPCPQPKKRCRLFRRRCR